MCPSLHAQHTLTLYSNVFPEGDMNGNLFPINVPGFPNITNLHSFYDSAATLFPTDFKRPLSPGDLKALQDAEREIMLEFPRCVNVQIECVREYAMKSVCL